MSPTRRSTPLALVALGTTLVLAGCSGTADDAADPTATGGGNYVIAVAQDFQGADRAAYSSEAAKTLADIMQSRLLDLATDASSAESCADTAPPELLPESALVESWSVAEDGMSIDFALKDGVESAAGNALTAADVDWTIDRIQAIDTTGTSLWFTIGGFDPANPITVHDELTFTLNLTAPNALAPYALAGTAGLIYDSATVKEHVTADDPWGVGWLKDHTANFGPWDLTSFTTQQLVFEANENDDDERGTVDTVTVQTVPDASSRIQLVQTGQASEVNGLDYSQIASLAQGDAATVVMCESTGRDWLGLNATDPVLGDTRVRQAISLALDREAIASDVYSDFANPATSGLSASFDAGTGEFYEQDVDRARELLAEAGYPDGFAFELSVSPAQPGAYSSTLATLVQQQLGAVGIDVTITTVPSAVDYRDAGRAQQMQAWLLAESPAFVNPGYSAWLTAGEGGLQNYSGFLDPTLDGLADQLMSEAEPSADATAQLAALIDEKQPAVYLTDRSTIFVRATCVSSVPTSTLAVDYSGATSTCS
jgi:peptide/nickel transport system substrate-binding protein